MYVVWLRDKKLKPGRVFIILALLKKSDMHFFPEFILEMKNTEKIRVGGKNANKLVDEN